MLSQVGGDAVYSHCISSCVHSTVSYAAAAAAAGVTAETDLSPVFDGFVSSAVAGLRRQRRIINRFPPRLQIGGRPDTYRGSVP